MPDHTTTSAAAYLTERGYLVHSKRDGTDLPPSPGTVKQWCERGKIKARKAGWVWLIAEEELNKLLRKDKTMRTYTYTLKMIDNITSTDLRDEARAAMGDAQAASITIYKANGQPEAEAAEALWLPGEGRLGIAWGADATWADVRDLESGIEMWLNDGEAWAAAN